MNFSNPANTQGNPQYMNPPAASGFVLPTAMQSAAKPSTGIFPNSLSMNAPKTSVSTTTTTGAPTLMSWPTNTISSPITCATLTNFKPNSSLTTPANMTLCSPITMQNKPLTQNTAPIPSSGFTLNSNPPATTAPAQSALQATVFRSPDYSKTTAAAPVAPNTFTTAKPISSTTATINPQSTTVTVPSTQVLNIPSTTVSTTLTSSSLDPKPAPTSTPSQPLTFQQLEELILNKWTAELYEQEKVFLNQATQINIWDKIINENAEKLTQLHSTMEKVRKQQTKINDDLEVIASHQKDLETCLIPMEKEDLLSVLKSDPNRKNLYSNAKKIDSQIKSMSENLKETIEHINETSRSHDTEDPVIQVGRILNAHMESLRWIDEHTARMQDYFDSLLKIHDDLRRDCDLTKHDIY